MKLSDKQKEQLSLAAYWLVAIIFFGGLSYLTWHWGRQLNYNLGYEEMVQETICETVKREHLINPELCEKL